MRYGYIPISELWYSQKDLHHGIQITAVANVVHSSQTGAVNQLKLTSSLLQQTPLPRALVHIQFKLCHGFIRLEHIIHQDSKFNTGLSHSRLYVNGCHH
jgi:hypothetical protein